MATVEVIKGNRLVNRQGLAVKMERIRVAAYIRVSTNEEDQLNSYRSQKRYYSDLIGSNADWILADIYADEAITGTKTDKRDNFQRLINDCLNGKIDMVITKAIARFARNTLDTLKYVRMLKERNIAVLFEEEHINTLTMDGELLLTVLSSVAQQEVENTSAHVKKGLKMKMQRGELCGYQGSLGYTYDRKTKTISINAQEAEIVKYIFMRYTAGIGCNVIAKELGELGYRSPKGNSHWCSSTICGIIKNEKYKGDVLQGKTFTVDPISKRRIDNFGEEDQFYISDHHEAIISEEDFALAQQVLARRNSWRKTNEKEPRRELYSRRYPFSSMLICGFCGKYLTRRAWNGGTTFAKTIWICSSSVKKGKASCLGGHCKGIPETMLKDAFVETYNLLAQNNQGVIDMFMDRVRSFLNDNNQKSRLLLAKQTITRLQQKRKKLLDMHLDGDIDRRVYETKERALAAEEEKQNKTLLELEEIEKTRANLETRLATFRKALDSEHLLTEFDPLVFETVVDRVIVGKYNDDGTTNPYSLRFVFKTGQTRETWMVGMRGRGRRKKEQTEDAPHVETVCLATKGS